MPCDCVLHLSGDSGAPQACQRQREAYFGKQAVPLEGEGKEKQTESTYTNLEKKLGSAHGNPVDFSRRKCL